MAYEITISDTVDEMTIEFPAPPLIEDDQHFESKVTVLNGDVYTDYFATKRVWQNTLSNMSETDFNRLKAFSDRQRSLWQYPTISIPDLSVSDVVVDFSLTPRRIINNCGDVENVGMTFRETSQMSQGWGSS